MAGRLQVVILKRKNTNRQWSHHLCTPGCSVMSAQIGPYGTPEIYVAL